MRETRAVSLLKIFVVSSEISECAAAKVFDAISFYKILNRMNVKSREFTLQIWNTVLLCIYVPGIYVLCIVVYLTDM